MIILANKEVYRLDINIGVSGDGETKAKLTATEKMAEQTKKKMQTLDKIKISPTAKLNDKASSTIDKINSKHKDLNRSIASPTARLNDQASSKLKSINSEVKKLEKTSATANVKIKEQNSSYKDNVKSKTSKLSSTNVNPTAKNASFGMKTDFGNTKDELNGLDGEFRSASVSIPNSLDKIQNKAKSIDNSTSASLKNVGDSVSKAGKSISSVGDKLSTNVTLPIVGLGIAAAKIGMDFESQMSRVKAISGATGGEFKKLNDLALQLGADTAFSAKQAAEGMESLASSGFTTNQIISAMPGLLDLAASSGESLATSSNIATSTLRGFGLAADQSGHVADVLAKNAAATNAAVADTGESMKYIAPVAQTAGWSLESVTAAIGEMANSGIKGSQSGTTLRSMFSSLAKPSDNAAAAMENMGFKAYDANHKMKSLKDLTSDLEKSTANMTDEQKQNTIATVFGQEAMSGVLTLIKSGSEGLDSLTESYVNSDGAAKEMAKTMQDNAKSSIEQMMGSIETAAIKIEGAFAPSITKLANYVQDLANKFSALSPEQQEFYTKLLLGAAVLGPVAKLVGGLTSGIGGIIKIGGKVASIFAPAAVATEAVGVAGATAAGGLGELVVGANSAGIAAGLLPAIFSPVGLAVAAVGVTAGLVAYGLSQDVIPKVDLFADGVELSTKKVTNSLGNTDDAIQSTTVKISDATKKSVGAYMEMDNKVQKSLLNMKFTNATLTSDMAKDLTTTFSTMGQTINTELDKDLTDSSEKIQKMLSKSSLAGSDQTDILAQIQNHYTGQKTTTKNAMDEINGILATAAENGGKITSDQYARIDELRTKMTTTAVTSLSETEQESAVILGRIKDQSTRITAETASDIVKQLEDQRVKTIDSANVEYAERVKIAEAIRLEGGDKATQTADSIITEAQRQRDQTIQAANDTKTQGIDTLKQSYTELGSTVNEQSGKILNWWDRLKAWWGSNSFETKTAAIDVTQNPTASGSGSITPDVSSYTPTGDVQKYNFPDPSQNMSTGGYAKQNYTGTGNATRGINSVAERGMELVLGRKFYNFKGGEKVLNNKQTTDLLSSKNSIEPSQSKQGQYQVFQPQMQVAGAGGVSVGDIQVNVNGNQDADGIVQEAVQVIGYKLKDALANIKK